MGDVRDAKRFLNAPFEELTGEKTEAGDGGAAEQQPAEDEKAEKPGMTAEQLAELVKSMPESVAVLNGTGKSGVAGEISTRLQKIGVDVVHTGNAKHFDYRYSNIVYPSDAPSSVKDTAKTLGKLLRIPDGLVRPGQQAFYASLVAGHDYNRLVDAARRAGKDKRRTLNITERQKRRWSQEWRNKKDFCAPYKKLIDALIDKHALEVTAHDLSEVSGFADIFIVAIARLRAPRQDAQGHGDGHARRNGLLLQNRRGDQHEMDAARRWQPHREHTEPRGDATSTVSTRSGATLRPKDSSTRTNNHGLHILQA